MQIDNAIFGAGCFWGVEARFRELEGVLEATSGYMGGQLEKPDYEAVCRGDTGHAEVVQVRFDADKVSFEALLALFFEMHNPTTLNRQGVDVGSQYRSVIFFNSTQQQTKALQAVADAGCSGQWTQPVVTAVEAAMTFWPAEEYHQRYLEKNGSGLCGI